MNALAARRRHPAAVVLLLLLGLLLAAATLAEALGAALLPVVDHVEDDFLLHVWSRTGRSVAATEGIVP